MKSFFPFAQRTSPLVQCCFAPACVLIFLSQLSFAQGRDVRFGRGVPPEVRLLNQRSLDYLAKTQRPDGTWEADNGPGVTGICVMAFLASGEDPDYGPYAEHVRRALRHIIQQQHALTGHIRGPGHGPMYHHGFATLALSEAYGVVNEKLLWEQSGVPKSSQRSLGQSLELAVRLALTAQKDNPWGGWRYSPTSRDADTTVSGTVLMGLLGAKNAGIGVPNEAIDKAVDFFTTNTTADGNVFYQPGQNHGDSLTRSAIATLVLAIAKRTDTQEFQATSQYIKRRIDETDNRYPFYHDYYMAQALFHSDIEAWEVWNDKVTRKLQSAQQQDGSFHSSHGSAYATGMSVLTLALNYRLLPVYER